MPSWSLATDRPRQNIGKEAERVGAGLLLELAFR